MQTQRENDVSPPENESLTLIEIGTNCGSAVISDLPEKKELDPTALGLGEV